MTLSLDADVLDIATKLANRRKVSPAEVLREVLTQEWQRELEGDRMRQAVKHIQENVRALSDPKKALPVDKAFIDSLYE